MGRSLVFFFFQAEDGIRDYKVTGVQTCALPIFDLGRGDLAAKRMARSEWPVEHHPEPCAELSRIADRAPYPFAGRSEHHLLLDAIGDVAHGLATSWLPGGRSRSGSMQPLGCAWP